MSEGFKIRQRVNGKLYGSISDVQRTIFIAAALDMLEHVRPFMWEEHKARADAVIHYVRLHDLEALRKRFDEYVITVSNRQLQGAANCLYAALNEWCGYKPPSMTLEPNLTAKIIYFVVAGGIGFFGGLAIARFVGKHGGGRTGATFALLATIAVWYFVLIPLFGKFIARKRVPIFLQELFFNKKVSQPPAASSYGVEPIIKARIGGQQYAKFPVGVRTTFLVGALDMLSFAILYVAPQYHAKFDSMIRGASAFKGSDIETQFEEYLAANESLLQGGAVSGFYAALDDWSKSGPQLTAITQVSASRSPTI